MDGRGFTLVELLLTLAVAGILLAIAIPSYGFLVDAGRLSAVTNDLVSALHLARSESIKRKQRVTVCKTGNAMALTPACDPGASWHQGWLIFVDDGTRGVIDAGDRLLRIQGEAAAIITANNFSSFISYLPNGVSQGANNLATGTLHLCVAGKQRDIIINNTGRPRLANNTC
ncbi:MAG: pilus assembly protein [Hydrogenophilales bacterium 12-61-10]|nr:MAG: pilus assembly protein [Hydrogenophilales bacterium 12-61-10]OYX27852.1 MAG: pilus assembly protein [Hydrogenophilales bacterium 32-62-9]